MPAPITPLITSATRLQRPMPRTRCSREIESVTNATRDLVKSTWYRDTFAITWTYDGGLEDAPSDDPEEIAIRSDNDAVSDWATTAGGRRYSRSDLAGSWYRA